MHPETSRCGNQPSNDEEQTRQLMEDKTHWQWLPPLLFYSCHYSVCLLVYAFFLCFWAADEFAVLFFSLGAPITSNPKARLQTLALVIRSKSSSFRFHSVPI